MQSLFDTNIDLERFLDYGGSAETTSSSSDGGDAVLQGTDAFYPLAQYQYPFSVGSTEAVQKDNGGANAPLPLSHRTDWLASLEPFPNFPGEPNAVVELPDGQKQNDPTHGQAKFQCWDHGCNGREFSSKSNLIRHGKERSSRIAKCTCSLCGAVFTRSSARDTHLARQSCGRIRRYSNGRPRPSRLALLSNPKLVDSLQDMQ